MYRELEIGEIIKIILDNYNCAFYSKFTFPEPGCNQNISIFTSHSCFQSRSVSHTLHLYCYSQFYFYALCVGIFFSSNYCFLL